MYFFPFLKHIFIICANPINIKKPLLKAVAGCALLKTMTGHTNCQTLTSGPSLNSRTDLEPGQSSCAALYTACCRFIFILEHHLLAIVLKDPTKALVVNHCKNSLLRCQAITKSGIIMKYDEVSTNHYQKPSLGIVSQAS